MIVDKIMTGESCPLHRVLAFLDPLLRRPPMVVEADNVLLAPGEVGDDEPNSGEKLATMPFRFRDYPTLTIPRRGLVPELVVYDDWSLRRTPNRPRHELLNFTVQDVIGG